MKLKRIQHLIQTMNDEDKINFYDSLQEVIQTNIDKIYPLIYHDYKLDDYLKN